MRVLKYPAVECFMFFICKNTTYTVYIVSLCYINKVLLAFVVTFVSYICFNT